MHSTFDIAVIGAGIAGAAAAYFLGARARVLVLEQESQPGYHSTGRSAALFTETYGLASTRALTAASRSFLASPPAGFAEHPILTPRGVLLIGQEADRRAMAAQIDAFRSYAPGVRRLEPSEALAMVPILNAARVGCAMLEPDAKDIDTHALHSGYLRGSRAQGATIVLDAEVESIARSAGVWRLTSRAGTFEAPIVVDAAGAWADAVAQRAGLAVLGLVPKRRTAVIIDAAANAAAWPMVMDLQETFYFKPDAGRLLLSPADETPSPPVDAQPEELDIALAVERFEQSTSLSVARIVSKWAGLRVFAPDKALVAGFDPCTDGFFWLAGQGGYGIQTSAAMGRIAAGLILDGALPADIASFGISAAELSPGRFR
ncbi:MAG: FAD-binding oxidoreductase [Burkholderiales bacterium]|nr:FAD-binding oxidoreductase [Burkholderiales bacterium]